MLCVYGAFPWIEILPQPDPVETYTSPQVIIPILVGIGKTEWTYIGGPEKFWEDAVTQPLGTGAWLTHMCHLAKSCRSTSNGTSVITEIRRKNWPLAFQGHSRSPKPTMIDRLLMTSSYWFTALSRAVSEINGNFCRKLQIFPVDGVSIGIL